MLIEVLQLLGGFVLLLGGGDFLVRGAAALARRFGISAAVVGLTVVAFGTSAPELVVCLFAVADGTPGVAVGNIVGSNIANLGLLLGLTAIIRPVAITGEIVSREIPMMVLAGAVTFVLFMDGPLQDGRPNALERGDGIVLLLLFGVFMHYTIVGVLRGRRSDILVEEAGETPMAGAPPAMLPTLALVIAGSVGLAFGGDLLVDGSVALATRLGVPEMVIAATIIAVGTSLPELVTCVIAVRKDQGDLAVGNVVGSNLFNLLLVLGVTSTVAPLPLPEHAIPDLIVMNGIGLLLLPIAITRRKITRIEGSIFVAIFVGYMLWQATRFGGAG